MDLIAIRDNGQFTGNGVRLDLRWIANNTLLQWYRDCEEEHGDECKIPSYLEHLPSPGIRILIDTFKNCLTPAPRNASYLALSYVWGQVDVVKTFKANSHQLQKPGALEGAESIVTLPKTVRHAMFLTRMLGERYLWVDSLCIVQDDGEMLNDHLNRMASIFAHASAVIIAIDGKDADCGLRGLKGAPSEEPRHLQQEIIPFGDRSLLRRMKMSDDLLGRAVNTTYFDRGWTFQEFLFARRRICFENHSTWFQCCQSTMTEDHCGTGHPFEERDFTMNSDYPSLTVFSRMLQDFNQRKFKCPQDCHPAFAGMLPCYAKVFQGGILYGLPEMFFDAVLLWQPSGDLVRRVRVELGTSSRFANDGLPTWSWVGWQGKVDFTGWSTANDFVAACSGRISRPFQQTSPVTTWYTGTHPGTTARRKIDVEWIAWRDRYKNLNCAMPRGWSRRRRKINDTLTIRRSPDGYGKFLYWHDSARSVFWYPIPLPDSSSQPITHPQTLYLFGSVQTAQLFASGTVWTYADTLGMIESACITLRTSQNEWAGFLRLHSRDYFAKRGLDPGEDPVKLQLVSISRGLVEHGEDAALATIKMEEYKNDGGPKNGERHEYYNVMCISWKDGVAFREALGRVRRGVWDALEPSTIDIVLG